MKPIRYMAGVMSFAIAFAAGTAQASIGHLLFPDTNFEDDTLIEHIDNDAGAAPGQLTLGDDFRGIFRVRFLNDNQGPGTHILTPPPNDELSGIFSLRVVAVCPLGSLGTAACTPGTNAYGGNGFYDYLYGPTPGFGASLEVALGNMDLFDDTTEAGIAFAMFTDSVEEFPENTDPCVTGPGGTCEAAVIDGDPFLTTGIGGDLDEVIFSAFTPSGVVGLAAGTDSGQGVANVNYALSALDTFGLDIVQRACGLVGCSGLGDGFADVIGGANPKGKLGLATNYDMTGDADFNISFQLPEPGSLALVGLSLISVGFVGRRRRSVR